MNNGGEFETKTFLEIYPTEVELKVENNGNNTTYLDLDMYFFYHYKIPPITSYNAIKNENNKTGKRRIQNLHNAYTA